MSAGEGSTWHYLQTTASLHWATCIPYVGLVAGGNTLEVTLATFHFDAEGRYRTVETSTERRYQNMWASIEAAMQAMDETEQRVRAEMTRLGLPFDETAWKTAKDLLKLQYDVPPKDAPAGVPVPGRP